MTYISRKTAQELANDQLVNALGLDLAPVAKSTILNEMRRRIRLEESGRIGYAGCSKKLSAYC